MKYILIGMFFLSITIHCSNKERKTNNENHIDCNNVVEDFESFFLKFHSDSTFQLNRIIFPLEGKFIGENYNPTKKEKKFYWKKKEWNFQSDQFTNNEEFKQEKDVTDTLVKHKIFTEESGFSIERHFKLIKCKWYLIYYSEVNL